ncbi:hypothetical protein [Cohnella faecalis]|uniref:hypothetical protein n=1 Tax=Cohnella faecalis TaxID=2315694 RepID=UPI0011C21BDA|nr:hypothetical protein [Cohnella faecalis]
MNLSLRVKVPKDGRNSPYLLIGKLKVNRLADNDGVYGGELRLPRDIAFRFRITTDTGVQEAGRNGKEAPFRILKLPGDAAIDYEVERWSE